MNLIDIISNKVLVIPICAWAISQLIKVIIKLVWRRRITLRDFVASGGMPSSHTALVCSLAAVVAVVEGFASVIFAVVAIFALVVMYDATGVRQSVSKQSIVLNRIVKELLVGRIRTVDRDLRELIGHTPFQVLMGALLGVLVAWLGLVIAGV